MIPTSPSARRLTLQTGIGCHLLEWDAPAPAGDHTVILLHGFLDQAWTWEAVVEAGLAGSFHLVAPDLRGHGDSDRVGPGGYYHFPDYLADLEDLQRQIGRARVSLVGHSMGGSVAAYFAGTFPDRVFRLALLEGIGPPEMDPISPSRVAHWIRAWGAARGRAPRSYADLDEAAARLSALDPLLPASLARHLAERGTERTQDGRLRFKHDPLHATPGPHGFQVAMAERFWREIRCETLLLEGTASSFRLAPEDRARRLAAFSHARSALVEGAGHMMQRHRPAQVAQLLKSFLSAPLS